MAGASSGGDANYWPGFVDALTNVVIAMVFVIVVLAMALSFSAQLMARRMTEKMSELRTANASLAAQAAQATQAAQAASMVAGTTAAPVPGALAGGPPVATRVSQPVPVAVPMPATPAPAQATPPRGPVATSPAAVATVAAASAPAAAPVATPQASQRVESNLPQPTVITVRGDEVAASAPGGRLQPVIGTLVLDYTGSALRPDDEAQRRLVDSLGRVKDALAAASPGTRVLLVARGPDMAFSDNQRTAYLRVMSVRNTLIEQGIAAERITTRIDTTATPGTASVSLVLDTPR